MATADKLNQPHAQRLLRSANAELVSLPVQRRSRLAASVLLARQRTRDVYRRHAQPMRGLRVYTGSNAQSSQHGCCLHGCKRAMAIAVAPKQMQRVHMIGDRYAPWSWCSTAPFYEASPISVAPSTLRCGSAHHSLVPPTVVPTVVPTVGALQWLSPPPTARRTNLLMQLRSVLAA